MIVELLLFGFVAFLSSIYAYNSLRNRHRLTKSAVGCPRIAPWRRVYWNADDSSFLELTEFTRFAFNELLKVLFEEDELDLQRRT
jgi:hypothetical protein